MDDATIIAKVKGELTWIQKHERLLLVALGGLVLWFAIGKIDTLIINHDSANLAQAKVTADAQAKANATLAAQASQQAAQYQALAAKLDAQNAAIVAANTQLATALAQRQKTDATLPPTELASRWNTLVPSAGVSISNGQFTLPVSGVVATVQQLEEVSVLRTQKENDDRVIENSQELLKASNGQVTTLNTEVTGLHMQIVDEQTVCTAQIALVKAEARKSKRRWFVIGYVAGFLSRQAIKSYLGV